MKLILAGATGVAGLAIYRAALADPAISKITLLIRRELPDWIVLPSNATEKTQTITHSDFITYSPELAGQLAKHDACIWALGKASQGMSEAEYTSITYDYPIAFIRALKDAGAGSERAKGEEFRFVYISGELADTEQKSWQMWARVKGRAEKDLTSFAETNVGFATHIIRPGYFFPSKEYPTDRLHQRGRTADCIDRILTPIYSTLSPSFYTPIDLLGKGAVEIAKGRYKDTVLFRNKLLRELGDQI